VILANAMPNILPVLIEMTERYGDARVRIYSKQIVERIMSNYPSLIDDATKSQVERFIDESNEIINSYNMQREKILNDFNHEHE